MQLQPVQSQPVQTYQPAGRVYAIQTAPVQPGITATPPPSLWPAATATAAPVVTAQPAWGTPTVVPAVASTGTATRALFDAYSSTPASVQPAGFFTSPTVVNPTHATPALGTSVLGTTAFRRLAHIEGVGTIGDQPESLGGNLFLPFYQQPGSFWFADLRGIWDDQQAAEGNFGIAHRRLRGDWILGAYGFYDLRHTQFNNNFNGVTLGVEALNLDWEGRLNWYLPEGGSQRADELNAATLVGDTIVVQEGLEQALYGFDGEIGRLLWRPGGGYDAEVRGFIGGFFFENSGPVNVSFGGPRARLEGRLFDLPLLGLGSRVTLEARVQYDDVRDFQGLASIALRIPLGGGRRFGGGQLSPIERRMLSPIRRDEDIVTATGLAEQEQAVLVGNGADGLVLSGITEINSATVDVATAVAGGSNIALITENVTTDAPVVLNPNQILAGTIAVRGQTSGVPATFGTQPILTGAGLAAGQGAVQVADNSVVTGLDIVSDQQGIVGNNVTGFTIANNTINATAGDAINLNGSFFGDITGNRLTSNSGDGLEIDTFNAGTISGNTSTGNGDNGFNFQAINGGTISRNTADDNDDDGFNFQTISGGTISGNRANDNDENGFNFQTITGGTISGNTANNNGTDGFFFTNINGAGVAIDSNTSTLNTDDGFAATTFAAGTFSNNIAGGNGDVGFEFPGVFAGTAIDNNNGGELNTGGGDNLP